MKVLIKKVSIGKFWKRRHTGTTHFRSQAHVYETDNLDPDIREGLQNKTLRLVYVWEKDNG